MKWEKIGKIFDPSEHGLINNCYEYAQSPQALVFSDFVRVYFSTRARDHVGKYLSHIAYVDFTKDFKRIIGVSKKEVIPLGKIGCFDEHGIFPMNVLWVGDKVFAYTSGISRRKSVSVETSIGMAISEDKGETFKKLGDGPVLSASSEEPFLVGDPFVQHSGKKFHMWYIYGVSWKVSCVSDEPERVYKIGHAVSFGDGIVWQKEGKQIVPDKFKDECQALPTVVDIDCTSHMLFCYRHATDFRKNHVRGYHIGYAYSTDKLNWIRDDSQAGIVGSLGQWDSDMQCYPHLFKCDKKVYLLYNGNEFGHFGFGLAILKNC
ncbi:MAG TPA: hypothetical protein DCL44_11045 [Elusimicrobia bacterium]|nr:hypothetical protein [Elusimicrobiota bacterium]